MDEYGLAATAAVSTMVVAMRDTEDMLMGRMASLPIAKAGEAIEGATPVETPAVAMGSAGDGISLEVVMGKLVVARRSRRRRQWRFPPWRRLGGKPGEQ